jgi:hypothetical protein
LKSCSELGVGADEIPSAKAGFVNASSDTIPNAIAVVTAFILRFLLELFAMGQVG